ncbi:hypothetical protein BH18ACI4_BH18ACI4_10220 [soil metagenome]
MHEKIHVYAIVRIDEYDEVSPEDAITIKEILPTMEEAIREVERLNNLQEAKHSHYFWQLTRYFPKGRTQGLEDPP